MFPRASPDDRRKCRVPIHMTAARTVFQFRHRVVDHRRIHFLMSSRLEVPRVTARTVRLVSSESPGNDFIVSGMTSHTGYA